MIITDPPSDSTSKSARTATSYGATTTSTPSISSMGNPPATAAQIPLYSPPPYQPQSQDKSRKRLACRRFFHAFIIALGIYLIVSVIIRGSRTFIIGDDLDGIQQHPLPTDGDILECFPKNSTNLIPEADIQAQASYPFRQQFSYSLPLSSELIYFLSRGNYGHGSLEFITSDEVQDSIEVDIMAVYYRPRIMESSSICLLTRNNNERGIGFFTPEKVGGVDALNMIRFTTVVKFPADQALSEEPLVINGLDTRMGIWSHSLSLDNLIKFNKISLRGSNSPISIKDVVLEDANFRTSNGPITGTFTVHDKLVLKTSNALIDIDLTMNNKDGSRATTTDLKTSNGAITASIRLVSQINDEPAAFAVNARSSNAPLTISFPEAPTSPFPVLDLVGSTSNARVETHLHPTFEGSIELQSSIIGPSLEQDYTTDPSGRGRERIISTQRVRGRHLSANVKWGASSPAGKSQASLRTSNAPNTLYL